MLSAYWANTFLVASVVLAVALSIDLAHYLGAVLDADRNGTLLSRALFVLWYIGIRATDRITEFLPLVCFFGIFSTEIRETRSSHRQVFQIAGRTPVQCLAPLLIFSALAGVCELTLLVYLRPAAVMAQAKARVGEYGVAFNRSTTADRKWIAADDDLVLANIKFSSPPSLRDLRLFRLDNRHQLLEVVDADAATPIAGEKVWLLSNGRRVFESGLSAHSRISTVSISLDIDPLWLSYFGIDAKYLPNDIFNKFESIVFQPDDDFRTWRQARVGIALMSAEMALLAGFLSLLLLATEIRTAALLFVVGSGFAAHILSGALLVLGENGRISPAAAVWPVPIAMLLLPAATYLWLKIISRESVIRAVMGPLAVPFRGSRA
jgi:lipopolysaccharide export LptBFGC system permease protein LptF